MTVSPGFSRSETCVSVSSVTVPDGTISHTIRGAASLPTASSTERAPSAPFLTAASTDGAWGAKPTTRWPPRTRRVAMLRPILPKPIIASSISTPPSSSHCLEARLRRRDPASRSSAPSVGRMRCAGKWRGRYSPYRTSARMPAFSDPLTRNMILCAELKTSGVSVTRHAGRSPIVAARLPGQGAMHRTSEPGKSEAVCPSSPRPSKRQVKARPVERQGRVPLQDALVVICRRFGAQVLSGCDECSAAEQALCPGARRRPVCSCSAASSGGTQRSSPQKTWTAAQSICSR